MRRLVAYMKRTGLSQAELARRALVDRPTISKVLTKKRPRFSPEAASRIAAVIGGEITVLELLGLPAAAAITGGPRARRAHQPRPVTTRRAS